MTYRYKLPPRFGRARRPVIGRPAPIAADEETLTGRIRGRAASDLEEVYARALRKSGKVTWWKHQILFGAPARNLSGAKTLDFLVFTGTLHPVQIDDEWIHKSASTKAKDARSDQFIFMQLRARGARLVKRIKGNKLRVGSKANQEKADRLVEEMF